MKTRVFYTLLLFLSLTSCTKEKIVDTTVYVKTPTQLIGSWNWNKTHGGYALVTYDPSSTGKSIKIELDSLSTYRYFSNDSLKYESKFQIVKTKSIFNHKDSALMIIIDTYPMDFLKKWNDFISHSYFSFQTSDTLIFTDAAYDGFDHTYCRIK